MRWNSLPHTTQKRKKKEINSRWVKDLSATYSMKRFLKDLCVFKHKLLQKKKKKINTFNKVWKPLFIKRRYLEHNIQNILSSPTNQFQKKQDNWAKYTYRQFKEGEIWMTNKHMNRYSVSLRIREMQTTTPVKCYFTPARLATSKEVGIEERSLKPCWREGNWVPPLLKNNLMVSRHVKEARTPVTEKVGFWGKPRAPLAHYSSIYSSKEFKQPQCPSEEECMNRLWSPQGNSILQWKWMSIAFLWIVSGGHGEQVVEDKIVRYHSYRFLKCAKRNDAIYC